VFHTLASVVSGLWLNGYIEKLGDTTDVNFEVLFRRLEGAERISNVDLKGTMITMDRAYTKKLGIEAVVKLGGEVHGTRKKGNDFPFTYNKAKPAPGQFNIPTKGHSGANWAKLHFASREIIGFSVGQHSAMTDVCFGQRILERFEQDAQLSCAHGTDPLVNVNP